MEDLPSDTLIIFTSSPTGLGHIRVMNALIGGLSLHTEYTIVGVKDVNAAKIHALGSRIPILLQFTEFLQKNAIAEKIVSKLYAYLFSKRTKTLLIELDKIREKYPNHKNWIIVSTHFALSYPVVAVKSEIKKKYGINIFNILIITDDSPQRVWASNGTDIIFAPSHETNEKIKSFLPAITDTIIETVSFPVAPRLTSKLSEEEWELIERQLDPLANTNLHISIPVSGAAVQLDYLMTLTKTLASKKFVFTIIGQVSEYSMNFFKELSNIAHVQISTGVTARSTVKLYESAFFQKSRPAVEVTKPSEQTFKAILRPNERGGVIMLLTEPVGRQEEDNLNFLKRHMLMPSSIDQKVLDSYLLGENISDELKNTLHYKASHWRALKLPDEPDLAAKFIENAKQEGILYSMLAYIPETEKDLTSDGVRQIWKATFAVIQYKAGKVS